MVKYNCLDRLPPVVKACMGVLLFPVALIIILLMVILRTPLGIENR